MIDILICKCGFKIHASDYGDYDGQCPNCGTDWGAGWPIPYSFKENKTGGNEK